MTDRKFRADKLYKLAIMVVILLTVFFGIKAYLSFQSVNYYNSTMTQDFLKCHKIWDPFGLDPNQKQVSDCDNALYFQPLSQAKHDFNFSILIALVSPILFFGGTWLYKYLFPVKNE